MKTELAPQRGVTPRTGNVRQSNMELLRIVAMFLVLLVHANYAAFGWPRAATVQAAPGSAFMSAFAEYLSLVCVDVFVLLSGWFGIRFRGSGVGRLIYQTAAVTTATLLLLAACRGGMPGSWTEIFRSYTHLWFVFSYVVLYVLSPVLNAYAESAGRRQFGIFLASFYLLQTVADPVMQDFAHGFSALSFCGLYLLARYTRLHLAHGLLQRVPTAAFLGGYVGISLLLALLTVAFGFVFDGKLFGAFIGFTTTYVCPLIILSALCLLLFFSRLKFQSRVVNFLASGNLAVYVMHQNLLVRPLFKDTILTLHHQAPILRFIVSTFLFLAATYLSGILLNWLCERARRLAFPRW